MGELKTALKVLRVKHDLTQKEMADKLAVSLTTYSFIENGKSKGKVEFWQRVKEEFHVTAEDLLNMMK